MIEKKEFSIVIFGVNKQPQGRTNDTTLWQKDLREKIYYRGKSIQFIRLQFHGLRV